jgi:hypothetical protein
VKQHSQLEAAVQRWTQAGLIDAQAAARILAFEAGQERRASFRWPVFLAMVFGGILLAAGVTLFVAAHWSELSPTARFSLMLLMTALFHFSGAALANRFPALSTTLHALGTATLGAAFPHAHFDRGLQGAASRWATAQRGVTFSRADQTAFFLAPLAPARLIKLDHYHRVALVVVR